MQLFRVEYIFKEIRRYEYALEGAPVSVYGSQGADYCCCSYLSAAAQLHPGRAISRQIVSGEDSYDHACEKVVEEKKGTEAPV